MSQTVQTQFGTGTVVDHEVIRGRVSYKVEGPGFSTWIEAAAMPLDFQMMPHPDDVQDNSVTLPYNPSPQSWVNPADQNIVPGEQAINPEKRTAPADSVDFQADGESYEPGPDPKLFAANWERTRGEPSVALRRIFPDGREGRITRDGMGYSYELDINNSVLKRALGETYETASQAKQACEEAWEFHNIHNPRESGLSPEDIQAKLGPKYVNAFVEHDFTSLQARIDENPELVMAEYRERLAELVAQADQEYLERVGRNEALEASDHHIREAAWKDVRAKAVRLRHSGQVMTHAANPDVIAAQVTGDHGTYEVMVIRSNIFQGSSAVDSWTCECPWGQWAFQRSDKFMGRLCSHAYASLLELQSMTRSKTHNPRFRNTPGIGFDPSTLRNRRRSSRTAAGGDMDLEMFFSQYENEGLDLSLSTDDQWQWIQGNIDYDILVDEINEAYSNDELSASQADSLLHDLDGWRFSRKAEMVDIRPVAWDPYSRSLMNKLRALWEEGSRPGREKERNEEVRELVQELRDRGFATDGIMAARESFLSRPMGYEDIPDYGTSEDYIADHEMWKREDVTEPEFEYSAGGDHGVVNDLNDGGRNKTSALSLPKGTQVQRLNLDGSPSGQTGVVSRDHQGLTEWDQVTVLWDGDDKPSVNDLSEIQWGEYEDGTPTKRLDDPWNIHGAIDDYAYGEPPAYDSGDEFGGYEDPFYVDPVERDDWPEDDIVANFQRNAGWIMGGNSEGSGGNDDIAAAAAAHLRTAGRNFTMAEQQALIDEDDGQPYDRSQLRLDGTHYL